MYAFALGEQHPGQNRGTGTDLLQIEPFTQNNKTQQDGKYRNQVDEGRRATDRYAAHPVVVETVGPEADRYPEVDDNEHPLHTRRRHLPHLRQGQHGGEKQHP